MSEFDSFLEGLEGGEQQAGAPGTSPSEGAGAEELTELRARMRDLEASSAADRARAEQAAVSAAQAVHAAQNNAQWQAYYANGGNQQQQGFQLGDNFDAEQFLEDPEQAASDLEAIGDRLQNGALGSVHQRVAPLEQAMGIGAQQLGQLTQNAHTQMLDQERQEYARRGWDGFDEDMGSLRQKFHASNQLGALDGLLERPKMHQLLMLERDAAGKDTGNQHRELTMPSIGANGPINATTSQGNLTAGQAAFVRSWGQDPSTVDLNTPQFEHLKTELGGVR